MIIVMKGATCNGVMAVMLRVIEERGSKQNKISFLFVFDLTGGIK